MPPIRRIFSTPSKMPKSARMTRAVQYCSHQQSERGIRHLFEDIFALNLLDQWFHPWVRRFQFLEELFTSVVCSAVPSKAAWIVEFTIAADSTATIFRTPSKDERSKPRLARRRRNRVRA